MMLSASDDGPRRRLASHLARAADPAHFGFWLADDPGAPHCAFGYRAIDTTRGGRAGYLQFFLPQDTDPGLFWQAVLAVAHGPRSRRADD